MDSVSSKGKFSSGPSPASTKESLPQISVVVPVYKVEKYLKECVESILSQTFRDFELILVDDGSPDKCGEICDEFAKKDPRVWVFHKGNGGVTSARRLGVEKARAEWICFVDSDDILPKNALEDLFSGTKKFGDEVDIIEGSCTKFCENPKTGVGKAFDGFLVSQSILASGIEYAQGIVLSPLSTNAPLFNRAPWAKIIRKNLFEKTNALNLPKWIFVAEDTIMDLVLATKARTVVRVPQIAYIYRVTESGTFFRPGNHTVFGDLSLYIFPLFRVLKDLYTGLDEEWQRVARLFAISIVDVRTIIRRCDINLLDDPACKEILTIQKDEFPELLTRLFLARRSLPWRFVPDSVFKVIFISIREVLRLVDQLKKRVL